MKITEECPDCDGRGVTTRRDEDGYSVSRRCWCQDPAQSPRALVERLQAHGVKPRDARAAIVPWDSKFSAEPAWLWEWARRCAEGVEMKPSCWLFGLTGRGKTKACAQAAGEFIKASGRGLVWVQSTLAARQIMIERYEGGPHSLTESRMIGAPLLVIDEYGAEDDGKRAQLMDDVLLMRDGTDVYTLLNSNGNPADFVEARLWSRLALGEVVEMKAPEDYRDIIGRGEALQVPEPTKDAT